MTARVIMTIGVLSLLLAVLLVWSLTAFWPGAQVLRETPDGGTVLDWDPNVTWFGRDFSLPTETRLLWLAVIAAALGGFVHAATSFASYVGNRTFSPSWLWWYLLRPPIGVAMALLFYFVVRGGLLSTGATGSDVSPFGIAALSGLVGMFSKQAADKLRETFDSLFRTEQGDNERGNKLRSQRPESNGGRSASIPANADS